VAFDLDGTLVDTLPDLHEAANRVLGDLGRQEVDDSAVRAYVGDGVDRMVNLRALRLPGHARGARTGLRCYSTGASRFHEIDRSSAVMNFLKLENLRLEIRTGWRWWRPSVF